MTTDLQQQQQQQQQQDGWNAIDDVGRSINPSFLLALELKILCPKIFPRVTKGGHQNHPRCAEAHRRVKSSFFFDPEKVREKT